MLLLAQNNVQLVCEHIKGQDNGQADALSRAIHDTKYSWIEQVTNTNQVPTHKFYMDFHL